jgi:hypothetical protein
METKRGAPPKDPECRKSQVVQIRLTDAEKENCEVTAKAEGMKMSAWARKTLVRASKRRQARS